MIRISVGFLLAGAGLLAAGVPGGRSARELVAAMPLAFERNAGQVPDRTVQWVGRADAYDVAIGATGAVVAPHGERDSSVVRMQFVNARANAEGVAKQALPGKTNYLIGADPGQWLRDLPTYSRIEYCDVYDGIDVAWYGTHGRIEYDFSIRPGADPSRIRIRFTGVRGLALEPGGDIRIEMPAGALKLRVPEVYQESAGVRKRVRGRYVLRSGNEVRFELAAYDRSKPLVIDPTLVYATYLGGWNSDYRYTVTGSPITYGLAIGGVATDASGNIYVAGDTQAHMLQTINAVQPGNMGGRDAFVAKFDPTGTVLLYSTFIGGAKAERGIHIAVDAQGQAIIAGSTDSLDFPLAHRTIPDPLRTGNAGFALKLNANGNAIVYSTYVGVTESYSPANGVAIDPAGNTYVAGTITNVTVPSIPPGGPTDGYVTKLDASGTILYSVLLGDSGRDELKAITADQNGNAYVAGSTNSPAFATVPGANLANAGDQDAFAAKLNPDGTSVLWLRSFGGSGRDEVTSMTRHAASGTLYLGGTTRSLDLPTTGGVIQPAHNGSIQGFVASLDSAGASGFLTYVGGSKWDGVTAISLAANGDLVIAGNTTSPDFTTANAIQPAFTGNSVALSKSADTGSTWSAVGAGLPGSVTALSPDPSAPGTILAATSVPLAVFRSTDGGATWSAGPQLRNVGSMIVNAAPRFARSPANPSVVYLYFPWSTTDVEAAGNPNFNAARSEDGGVTWTLLSPPGDLWRPAQLYGLAVSPTNADDVYAVFSWTIAYNTTNVYRSQDGGKTFALVSYIYNASDYGGDSALAVGADGAVYFGTQFYLFKSTDNGAHWGQQNKNAEQLLLSPSNPSVMYAGHDYYSFARSADAGKTWTGAKYPVPTNSQVPMQISPLDPDVLYAAYNNKLWVSTDGAATWSESGALPAAVTAIAAGADDPASVYAATAVDYDGFVAKLSADGRVRRWSTYYAGSGGSRMTAIAAEPGGDVWAAGTTASIDLPITPNAYSTGPYQGGAFLARIADATAECDYHLNRSSIVSYGAGTVTLAVTAPSGCSWSATPSDSWITPEETSGTGSGILAISLSGNSTPATRSGNVSINGHEFQITQASESCTYSVTYSGGTIPATGGTAEIAVTAPAGCPWSTTPFNPLIRVLRGETGTGNGTVEVSFPANKSVDVLTSWVVVGTAAVSLQQANACRYAVLPYAFPAAGGSGQMAVRASMAGCTWTAASDSFWLWVIGSGTGSGGLSYGASENPTSSFRVAHITLGGHRLTVVQEPGIRPQRRQPTQSEVTAGAHARKAVTRADRNR